MADEAARDRLFELIRTRSFRQGEAFQLASGRTSTIYFDMKRILFEPEAIALVAELVLDKLRPEPVDLIGGMAVGAVPLVAAVSQKSWPERPLPGFFVRKTVKDHGTQNTIEGLPPEALKDQTVVMLEDVSTTGGSVMLAVRAARGAGASVNKVLTLVDRQEGAAANLAAEGLTLVSLYRADEFV